MSKEPAHPNPLVTVLISTFNRRRYFDEALRSITRQTYRNLQIIAVNDGGPSVSDIVESVNDPRVVLIDRRENRGLCYSFNQALQYAQGKYVAYLGDDDLFYPHHVERLVAALEGPTDAGVAYSDLYKVHCRIMDDGSRQILGKVVTISRDFDRFFMMYFNHTLHVSLLHRLDLLTKTGLYNEQVRVLIDWDLTRRLSFFTDFIHLRDITGEFYAPVGKSDRISYRLRKDKSDYLRNVLTIRTSRPPKPWPKMTDTSIILLDDGVDQALARRLRSVWMWTFVPYQLYLPQPAQQLVRLQTEMPNVIRVPVSPTASPQQRVDQALARVEGDYVAIVPPGLPIEHMWLENAVYALSRSAGGEGFLLEKAGEDCWGAVVRKSDLAEARRRYPSLSVRQSLEAINLSIRMPVITEMPFQFDTVLTEAKGLEKDGNSAAAARVYQEMQKKLPNGPWMNERMVAALYQAGGADQTALGICQAINQDRPTVEGLLLEARLLKRKNNHQDAAVLLEQAREILLHGQGCP